MKAIMDTGPWVALIDRSESRHRATAEWFRQFSGRLYSTEAVLTEVLYLLSFSAQAQAAAIDYVLKAAIEIVPASPESLQAAKKLMMKYADVPMDYADATLVCLAMEAAIQNIVTFDSKDFSIYRMGRARSFNTLP